MNNKSREGNRSFLLEQVFESWEEYQFYYEEACKVYSKNKKAKNILNKIIRRYLEVEFKSSLKAARYYYPEDSESIILQIPLRNMTTRGTGEKRIKLLDEHQHVIGTTEMYMRDQIAMRLKVLGAKVRYRRKTPQKSTKKKLPSLSRR